MTVGQARRSALALTFTCPCGASITVPDILAGHEGRCPGCDAALRAPTPARVGGQGHQAAAADAPAAEAPAADAPPTAPREATPAPAIEGVRVVTATPRGVLAPATKARLILEFPCPGCREVLRVATTHAGRAGRCTLCGATFDVPAPPDAAAPPATGAASTSSSPPEPTVSSPPAPVPGGESRARAARDAFRVVRVACACGRQVATPLARLEQGLARCPSCDRALPR